MSETARLNFDAINAAAMAQLPGLLAEWLPAGKLRGHEFKVGSLDGAPGDSVSINIRTCKGADFATDVRFGDPIGLYAAIYTHGDRKQAARDLGARLGVVHGAVARAVAPKVAPRAVVAAEYVSSPPPADAPPPPVGRADLVHVYHSADGAPVSYVLRFNATRTTPKKFQGLSYGIMDGNAGWHFKHPSAPRILYNLHHLRARPAALVLLVEGEKAADAAAKMLPSHVVMTWPGGAQGIRHVDFSPLANRDVMIWPDNDDAGHRAAADIAALLPRAVLLDVADLPAKADAADVTLLHPAAWLLSRCAFGVERLARREQCRVWIRRLVLASAKRRAAPKELLQVAAKENERHGKPFFSWEVENMTKAWAREWAMLLQQSRRVAG